MTVKAVDSGAMFMKSECLTEGCIYHKRMDEGDVKIPEVPLIFGSN